MREILFRGKRIDNDEWIEGRLFANDVIVPLGQFFEIEANYIYADDLKGYIVYPETVAEFAGFYDKNDKKIFEDDVCKGYNFLHENRTIYKIVFDEGQFVLCDESGDVWHHSLVDNIEVISNVHDNPELLKEG